MCYHQNFGSTSSVLGLYESSLFHQCSVRLRYEAFFFIFFIFILVHIDALGFIICSFWSVECGGVFVLLAYTRVHQGELLASEVVWSH